MEERLWTLKITEKARQIRWFGDFSLSALSLHLRLTYDNTISVNHYATKHHKTSSHTWELSFLFHKKALLFIIFDDFLISKSLDFESLHRKICKSIRSFKEDRRFFDMFDDKIFYCCFFK